MYPDYLYNVIPYCNNTQLAAFFPVLHSPLLKSSLFTGVLLINLRIKLIFLFSHSAGFPSFQIKGKCNILLIYKLS